MNRVLIAAACAALAASVPVVLAARTTPRRPGLAGVSSAARVGATAHRASDPKPVEGADTAFPID